MPTPPSRALREEVRGPAAREEKNDFKRRNLTCWWGFSVSVKKHESACPSPNEFITHPGATGVFLRQLLPLYAELHLNKDT